MHVSEWVAKSRTGKCVAVGAIVLCIAVIGYVVRAYFLTSEAESLSANRLFVCSVTGKSFRATIKPGTQIPVISPYTNEPTGYEAELCYWNAAGSIEDQPTPVMLNRYAGKPEPTFCPKCGR